MAFSNDNFTNRILEVLNYPIAHRCPELGLLVDRCSIRELQDLFPTIVNSIFCSNGGVGWGLRTITKEINPMEFEVLHNFFLPLGPMFRLCYRLLNDAIKFEISIDMLPRKMVEMLQTAQYSMFYADIINVDPFRRAVTSLSLNAFDFFILNFVLHGTVPVHKMFPAALAVHNERSKTAYFFLSADILCCFLPSNPDSLVMPTNICGTVKAPQPVPTQPLQPTKSPKYLTLSPVAHFNATSSTAARTPESPRAYAWRTESVLYFFIDTWLRLDVDETRDLPSSEFIRVVRILVKQIHAFGNAADIDNTSMAILRKIAQPMMNVRIYPFIRSLISRWPLDSSLSVVLELWLSYIQPWRYTFDRIYNNSNIEVPIHSKYDLFISDNLLAYTQIFVLILSRFERLDFSSFRNTIMLHRLIKVFSQSSLPQILKFCEQKASLNLGKAVTTPHSSPKRNMYYRADSSYEWEVCRTENYFHDDNYVYMFGDNTKAEIQHFLKKIYVAKIYVLNEMEAIKNELKRQYSGFLKYMLTTVLSLFEDTTEAEYKIQELKKIPDVLDLAIQTLSFIFEVNLPDISVEHIEPKETSSSGINFNNSGESDMFDISQVTPAQPRKKLKRRKLSSRRRLHLKKHRSLNFIMTSRQNFARRKLKRIRSFSSEEHTHNNCKCSMSLFLKSRPKLLNNKIRRKMNTRRRRACSLRFLLKPNSRINSKRRRRKYYVTRNRRKPMIRPRK